MAGVDKRYQVFISSTFEDLKEERQEVIQALLELDCIPAGMELFQAANESQWSLIRRVIDDCDYYIVIVAGRYGSIGSDDLSYTEMEYRYALETGKPILGFVHSAPGELAAKRVEKDPKMAAKLEEFRELVKQKPVRRWDSPADLGSKVSRALVRLIKDEPAVGWIRGDSATSTELAEEALRLRKRVEMLEHDLKAARTQAPLGAELLSQGSEVLAVEFAFTSNPDHAHWTQTSWTAKFPATWDQIFATIAPSLIDEASDAVLKRELDRFVERKARKGQEADPEFMGHTLTRFTVADETFKTVKVQLRALGLIALSERPRSVKDVGTYWRLTPYGDATMVRLRAIPKLASAAAPAPAATTKKLSPKRKKTETPDATEGNGGDETEAS